MRSPWNGLLVTVRTLALFLVVGLMAAACTAEDEVPRLERRAQAINSGIMCPVCPGESIDQSQHPLSVQMRAIVIEKLEQGWTGEEVRDFFVERYGPGVLLEPSREGANLLVWLVPPVGLALAGVLLFAVLRGMVRSQPGMERRLSAPSSCPRRSALSIRVASRPLSLMKGSERG